MMETISYKNNIGSYVDHGVVVRVVKHTQAQLACFLTVSRVCRILAAIDFLISSESGCFSLCVTKEERSVEGTIAFPVYLMNMPLMYSVHFVPVYGRPLLFCGNLNINFVNALVPQGIGMYIYVVSPHAFSRKLLLDECVLAMDTYHKQEVVALFCAEHVAVALNVP